jgi:hypothetical protein
MMIQVRAGKRHVADGRSRGGLPECGPASTANLTVITPPRPRAVVLSNMGSVHRRRCMMQTGYFSGCVALKCDRGLAAWRFSILEFDSRARDRITGSRAASV